MCRQSIGWMFLYQYTRQTLLASQLFQLAAEENSPVSDRVTSRFKDKRDILLLLSKILRSLLWLPNTKVIKWIIRDYWCLNWVHLVIKMPNLENIEFYTCILWDHNAKFLIMAYRRNSWMPNDCILIGID